MKFGFVCINIVNRLNLLLLSYRIIYYFLSLKKGKLKRELQVLKQQSDNALIVFGPNIPRLLKRIEEEYKKGRFKQRPRGPLGMLKLFSLITVHFFLYIRYSNYLSYRMFLYVRS